MLDGVTKWLVVGSLIYVLKAGRDQDIWEIMIANARGQIT